MNSLSRFTILVRCGVLGCIGLAGTWFFAMAAARVQDAAESALAGVVKPGEPGFAALVRVNGRTVLEKTFGVRDLRTKAKITAATNFRLASFTKQFTAMAVMLLAHDGKLRYDESLTEIFPEFPAYGRAITIRHLLQHTSGLPDYEELMDAEEKIRGPVWSAQHQIQDREVLGLLEKQPAGKFAPGASWSYSNSGYVVLGLIVAKVSGMPFRDFLATRIFQPLHMDGTVVFQKGQNEVANRAYGHSKRGESFVETDQSATSATLGDGGIYSSLADLVKWDDALRNHTLLSAAEMAPALVPARLNDGAVPRWPAEPGDDNLHPGQPVSYGYGWFLDPYPAKEKSGSRAHSRMWHYGSTMGFRTYIERFTDQPLTVVVLCNRTDLDPGKLAELVASVYMLPR
jgi:CubicO group peptidase (beta-lactamase class C family)